MFRRTAAQLAIIGALASPLIGVGSGSAWASQPIMTPTATQPCIIVWTPVGYKCKGLPVPCRVGQPC